ncbi:RluA family pseudouridine synthase [Haliangium ochraceum]|uniref:Pseudouridine synthase n=1 Tax=Haliangium ochraceum (strain DSM 14365 / JCM 11303 / SMP-2) TaxID=502025 RepID=D0LUH1_HALO1|nr:RluA family pseudouridine synthase [Haliangium ochraceum]ACY19294.1 pseudouridine synthase, RluA family [Haliangium ochraceum DSM 14365]
MSIRARTVRFEVADEDVGKRLDQLLAARVPELSRRMARTLLDIGGVFVDRTRVKVASRKLRPGQSVEVHLGGALERATKEVGKEARKRDSRALPRFKIVFEDRDLVVVDKPAGLLSAPTPESDLGNLAALLRERRERVYVVHRIDLQTSGLLVFAKTRRANQHLSERFREHQIERAYTAVVAGAPVEDTFTIDLPLRGRRATTHLQVLQRIGERAAVLDARLETGRTHQIRLHCLQRGYPVLGDPQYGERMSDELTPPRMALHARVLGFEHPRSGEARRFESELPADLGDWLAGLSATSNAAP